VLIPGLAAMVIREISISSVARGNAECNGTTVWKIEGKFKGGGP